MKLRHVFLYIAVICIAVASTNIAWAQTPITGCTIITKPGPYVLKNNITATTAELKPTWVADYLGCIIIAANFVTIDLSGYLITGPVPAWHTMGIAPDTTTRIGDVVQSGSITGFDIGVDLQGTGHTIKDVNASNNGIEGIVVQGTGNTIKDVIASNNSDTGIAVWGTGNTIKDVTANNNYLGISLIFSGNRVIGNTANNNAYGISVSTCPNLLLENMANGNTSANISEPVGCTDNRQENVPKP